MIRRTSETTRFRKLSKLARPDQINYPWWESTQKTVQSVAYHLRTRLGNVVGLLVDPGAHDNLVGERTLASMSKQAGKDAVLRPLASPMSVEGVGKSAQTAKQAGQVAVGVEGQVGTYTAPVIPEYQTAICHRCWVCARWKAGKQF